MKAKLIKENNFYKLIQNNTILVKISTNESINIHYSFGKLSLKNCQLVERDYDLENMADFYGAKAKGSLDFKLGANKGFEDGFQKALEILSDNKYSEENIEEAFAFGQLNQLHNQKYFSGSKAYIQSLQQTEWNVIIKTTCDGMVTGLCMPEVCDCNIIPKLDADGCLILKRI